MRIGQLDRPVLPAGRAGFGLPGQLAEACVCQRIGHGIEALFGIGQFLRRYQAQVALRQGKAGMARQVAPEAAVRHTVGQHLRMARAADMVGDDAGPGQAAAVGGGVVLQAPGQGAKGAGHGGGADNAQHRNAEAAGDIGGTRLAVVQAHDAFDQQDVVLLRRLVQAGAHIGFAIDPQVQLVDRLAAGELVPVRIQKVRAALEHLHAPALTPVQPGQRGGERGLALARCRRGDQQGDAAAHAVSSRSVSSQPTPGPW